jgi:glycosyltransferase involved in cell wall biosynthesis/ubiquinone/menaquinone biosynthesis C-methylase UbiE
MKTNHYIYLSGRCDQMGEFVDDRFESLTERHKMGISVPPLRPVEEAVGAVAGLRSSGVVLEMLFGWPTRMHLRAARRFLSNGLRVWFYWPAEMAVECIDHERLRSFWRLWALVQAAYWLARFKAKLRPYLQLPKRLARRLIRMSALSGMHDASDVQPAPSDDPAAPSKIQEKLSHLTVTAQPVLLEALSQSASGQITVKGTGAYLRTDFWAKLTAGGSYGHTCYVAKALAETSEGFVCFMAARYALLDDMGLRQVVLEPVADKASEANFLRATDHYYTRIRAALEALQPAYLYERLVLGNYVGARLSRDLGIPYIVEYNGSEISMSKSFGGSGFTFEDIYLQCEEAAFRQALAISVVSEPIKEDLIKRGIDPAKILVNPNGVDPGNYAPASAEEKEVLQAELGFSEKDRVIGFIGTFGGWHGIDILAPAIPRICDQAADARFLLIGDGSYKHLVEEQIIKHRLGDRARCLGALPQTEGARLLKVCDIYVSPHNAHMIDSRFFGSPTKIFEYMAMGGGIVASHLEQIGEVLSPALRIADLRRGQTVENERSVLCEPGNLDEFVEGVLYLTRRPDVCRRLGENSRQAAQAEFTWDCHVSRLLAFIEERLRSRRTIRDQANPPCSEAKTADAAGSVSTDLPVSDESRRPLQTGDAYKDECQNQWDNNPCGSQYAREADLHTLEWYLNVEAHRYGEYAPWMPETMEFAQHAGQELLEVGGGLGTDLSQFARNGAIVTDIDLSSGHLALAQENFRLRGLTGRFIHQDAETLPFADNSFDVVYSNGVIHHTPNTETIIGEIFRVLRRDGKAIIMVYAENSLYYWRNLVGWLGLKQGQLMSQSIGHIMSCSVEMSANDARPLVKVYTKSRLHRMFSQFKNVSIEQRQLTSAELPKWLGWVGLDRAGQLMGWNLIVKAYKP